MRASWTFRVSVGLVLVATVAACGSGSARTCAQALTAAAKSVDGVAAAEFTCQESFGNPSRNGSVTIARGTKTEVAAVMEGVLRAFAASAELGDAAVVYSRFASEDGKISVHEGLAGFNGTPSIGVLREHYGITPG